MLGGKRDGHNCTPGCTATTFGLLIKKSSYTESYRQVVKVIQQVDLSIIFCTVN